MSTYGRIKNSKTGKILRTNINNHGYEQVSLRHNNKSHTETVHRLIADTFIKSDKHNLDVRHKNDNTLDNRLSNLEYCTRSETIQRAFARGTKVPSRQVKVRVVETGEIFESIRACARALGLHQSDICKCVNGAAYTCGGLHFEKVKD